MNQTSLSLEQISTALTEAANPSDLYDTLAKYESPALFLSTTNDKESEILSVFYSTFFFSHLLTDQTYEARAMTQRMPQDLAQKDPSLQNCLTLLRVVWQQNHEQVYRILRNLPWPESLKSVVQSYDTYFQEKTLKEVSHAYEAIKPAAAAGYMGLDQSAAEKGDPAVLQIFTACGWTWDEQAGLLYPKPAEEAPQQDDGKLYHDVSQILAMLGKGGSR
ncbi:hypothetical protein P168DRAFT_86256 [Aspergillus campestris IBT 28561]|uniref:CSN8/PSMD8/EIF3K domain-containing protein n=1 Tax=Aspergillus campestris (strain IBT 28561) TaxID=1392248 RepID=A0A2I1DAX4_ASPC2|nr:uncharacterized protein P168DRAFT_86256 [Aspergillus campestris IBT 28561]PKY07018.1 hypothetical protein P168DRAFT_86256 [Aspergillus campestris IBT 28561]